MLRNEAIEGTPASAKGVLADDTIMRYNDNFIPPLELRLLRGMIVMLLSNLEIPPGLTNGSKLLILHHNQRELFVKVLHDQVESEYVRIPRMWLLSSIESTLLHPFKRLQFPVRRCFAVVINKCQGRNLSVVGMDLREDYVLQGQCYVGFPQTADAGAIHVFLV